MINTCIHHNLYLRGPPCGGRDFLSRSQRWPDRAAAAGRLHPVLPKYFNSMVDVSADYEKYDGFWKQNGAYLADPPDSDLSQYRLNFGYAYRISPNWQTSLVVPYVWNVNNYSSLSSRNRGIGDSTLNVWYEAREDQSAWKIRSLKDLMPAVVLGPSLVIPTGVSPYDDVSSSFDVTGRGFYRLDGNLIITKTYHPMSLSVALAYGAYLGRAVNREYGKYVEPYHKELGNRLSASVSLSYIYYMGTAGDALTFSGSFVHIKEEDSTIGRTRYVDSGFLKDSIGGGITYSGTDRDWSIRLVWNHAPRRTGWERTFPRRYIYRR